MVEGRPLDWSSLSVLVTGGTGSFGQKFTEMVLKECRPKKLIVFSRDELKQSEMADRLGDPAVIFMLGDVRDKDRLLRAFEGVDIVVHAAALKHVLTREFDASEAVRTNILGSQNVVDAAIDRAVPRTLLISTDKAAYPVSLYGASKLCAEKMFVSSNAFARNARTRLSCARYGNVLGSRGSVAPLFLRQRALGTVTITDPVMTRFMMTLEQGVRFVIQCIELMQGGEVFVPKVPSMRVMDLAKAIAPEARVKTIGRRVGEKIHEVLLTDDEIPRTRLFADDFFIVAPDANGYREGVWVSAKPLPDGFAYTSDANDRWLSIEDLRRMVEGGEA